MLQKLLMEEEKKFQNDFDNLLIHTSKIHILKEKYNENYYKVNLYFSKNIVKNVDKSPLDFDILVEYKKKYSPN